jgi:hypothetical protein
MTNSDERLVKTGGVSVGDVDDERSDDILVTDLNGRFLCRALEGGRFEEATVKFGLPRELRPVADALFADLDHDGIVDSLLEYRVFKSIGGKRFENITEQIAEKSRFLFGVSGIGLSVGDHDKVGRLDI